MKQKRIIILLLLILILSLTGYSQIKDPISDMPVHMIKSNPFKISTNEMAFSYEYMMKNKGLEMELGYIYPSYDKYNLFSSIVINNLRFPLTYFKGISANFFLKCYSSNNFYHGPSASIKYLYFDNKTISTTINKNSDERCDINYSQKRSVFGLGYSCGILLAGKHLVFDLNAAVGHKLINSKSDYNYYTVGIDSGNPLKYEGKPEQGTSYNMDNGIYCRPYLNVGLEIGFGWKKKW